MDLELQAPAKKKLDLAEDKVFAVEEKQVEKNSKVEIVEIVVIVGKEAEIQNFRQRN